MGYLHYSTIGALVPDLVKKIMPHAGRLFGVAQIDEETKKILFKKFIRSEEGSGLGLYISKLLIEDMGGQISLERSEVGKGSTFVFTLPLAQTE